MNWLNDIVGVINNYLWSYVLIVMLIGIGLWFTIRTRFVQIRCLPEMFRLMTEAADAKPREGHISTFQAFCVSTASRVGVGNIAGIAIAVATGGPGAVFWMWVIATIGAASGFVESTLAQIYKAPRKGGGFVGGPAYYIDNVLGSSFFATGFAIAVVTALVIFGGLNRIAKVVGVMVPIMAGAYILVALSVTVMNISLLPEVLSTVFRCAFDFDAVLGAGFGMALMTGIKRGLFSNEAGMGAVPNAAATADATHPAKQGLVQALGVYFDTLIICTASAMLVLLTPGWADSGKTGIALIQQTLSGQLGEWTNAFMSVTVLFFAFSSIIGNYFYGEINMDFISRHSAALWIYRAIVVMMVYLGSVASLGLVWNLADLFMALMAIVNLVAILLLGKFAFIALDDYIGQKRRGIANPEFDPKVMPSTKGILCWPRHKDEEIEQC